MRTPLNAILGWANLLRDGRLPEARASQAIEPIERNARAQARLIDDMLESARIEQGKLVLSVGPVEMVRVVELAIDSIRPAAEAKNIRLQPVLDSHATIIGDADRLQQVIWNLLSNAIKFTPKGGRVQVLLRRERSYVEVLASRRQRSGHRARLLAPGVRSLSTGRWLRIPQDWRAGPRSRHRTLVGRASRWDRQRAQRGLGSRCDVRPAAADRTHPG